MKWTPAFHIMFYPGSWVSKDLYQPFIREVVSKVGGNVSVVHPLHIKHPIESVDDNVYLMGHSMGSYFALKDAKRFGKKVSGLIMLNGNFNERMKMPYPGVSMSDIDVPTLSILNGRDERLPINRAMDDILVKLTEKHKHVSFIVNPFLSHFSGVTEEEGRDMIVDEVTTFIDAVESNSFHEIKKYSGVVDERLQTDVKDMSKDVVLMSDSLHVLDALLKTVLPRFVWNHFHWWAFLFSKPDLYVNYMYDDSQHVFIKGKSNQTKLIEQSIRHWTRLDAQIMTFTLPSIHPAILLWLSLPLYMSRTNLGNLQAPVLILPVNDHICYYKVPHPHRILSSLTASELFNSTIFEKK